MDYHDIITVEADKRGGQPCIRGLRITVYDVLSYLASGMTEEEIISDYPDLTAEDIRAALAYAADVMLMGKEDFEGWTADPELKAALIEAIAQCDRGETVSAEELLRELLLDQMSDQPGVQVDEEK